jgi:hypothetical protein
MFGRRSHSRFTITPASEGFLRVLRDVVLQPSREGEIIAISREPGVVGEELTVEVLERDGSLNRAARVAESRPVIIEGAVRHRLRLELV